MLLLQGQSPHNLANPKFFDTFVLVVYDFWPLESGTHSRSCFLAMKWDTKFTVPSADHSFAFQRETLLSG
jgi:hypothetical protein